MITQITKEHLKQIAPNAKDSVINPLVKYLNIYLPKYDVTSYLRICHFLSQAAHEADSFQTLKEYASGAEYEWRKDLGNNQKGDGVRYKGRGIFQLTGRANYHEIGNLIGMDLENNPELAETPEVSVLTALEYWKTRRLNVLADRDDILNITKRINGGLNGYDSRKKFLERAKKSLVGISLSNVPVVEIQVDPQITDAVTSVNIIVAKKGDKSSYVADLQNMLNKKGAKINADGSFGPLTEQAVKDFQNNNDLKVTGQIDTDTLNKLMV